jgi:hypothetical protein
MSRRGSPVAERGLGCPSRGRSGGPREVDDHHRTFGQSRSSQDWRQRRHGDHRQAGAARKYFGCVEAAWPDEGGLVRHLGARGEQTVVASLLRRASGGSPLPAEACRSVSGLPVPQTRCRRGDGKRALDLPPSFGAALCKGGRSAEGLESSGKSNKGVRRARAQQRREGARTEIVDPPSGLQRVGHRGHREVNRGHGFPAQDGHGFIHGRQHLQGRAPLVPVAFEIFAGAALPRSCPGHALLRRVMRSLGVHRRMF